MKTDRNEDTLRNNKLELTLEDVLRDNQDFIEHAYRQALDNLIEYLAMYYNL